jgi:hypothetical protein
MAKLNWERHRERPKTEYQKAKVQTRTRDVILNEAIAKLIVIKTRRKIEGEPEKRIIAVQKEIDKLMKMRDQYRKASLFVEWQRGIK